MQSFMVCELGIWHAAGRKVGVFTILLDPSALFASLSCTSFRRQIRPSTVGGTATGEAQHCLLP